MGRDNWIPAVEFETVAESIRDLGAAAVDDFLGKRGFAMLIAIIEVEIDHYAVAGVTRRTNRAFAIIYFALVTQIAMYAFAWEPLGYKDH